MDADGDGPARFESVTTDTALRLDDAGALTFVQNGQDVACERLQG